MANHGYFDVGYMDTLAAGDSPLHRIDPRVKLITTVVFIATVVSFNKYTVTGLIPFFSFPIILIILGGIPSGYILKKVLLISPFAILVGIFNPVFDRSVVYHIGSIGISGGWVSFISILLRFALTVTSALVLVALTGFNSVCLALEKFGVPKPFIVQLLFLYRYMFVLAEELGHMIRARAVRSFSGRAIHFKAFASIIGHLLLRTLDRAERVYRAMCCRGFDGRIRIMRSLRIGFKDVIFAVTWIMLFVSFRFWNIPVKLGELVTRIFT
ncbi:MAG: cobalt ECF transporter T component CbiQ [Candidatus Omnitrophica bacterium]|nr:cobalt ECF transporter T component CbiQ [Candidatus Omnitrophota bacterium]